MSLKPKKHKQNYSKAHHNQIALNTSDKKKLLKAARERHIVHKRTKIRKTLDFSLETARPRSNVLEALEESTVSKPSVCFSTLY